jgi:fucose 4-O-acetylase-like acetyltransferase
MKKRLEHIDVAKGIGILLIVFGHNSIVSDTETELFRIIFSFHVPLFIFLSGLFFKPHQEFKSLLISKSDSLLKPYFVTLLALAVALMFKGLALKEYIFWSLYGNGKMLIWPTLWFIPHLWILFIFSYFFINSINFDCLNKTYKIITLALLLIVGFAISKVFWEVPIYVGGKSFEVFAQPLILPGLPFSIDLVFINLFYFLLGYCLRSQVIEFKYSNLYFLLAFITFFCCHLFFDFSMDLNLRVYDNLFISTLQAISGIYIVLAISQVLSKIGLICRILAYVGSGSLFILIFHAYFQDKILSLLIKILANEQIYLAYFLAFLLSSIISLVVGELIKKNKYLSVLFLPLKYR